MASLEETWERHAQDIVKNNIAGLMGDITPMAMPKVMTLATNPIRATSYEVKPLGDDEVEITYVGDSKRVFWSKWQDTGSRWQIVDVVERPAG